MAPIRQKRNQRGSKHQNGCKAAFLIVESASNPIKTGASSYEFNSDSPASAFRLTSTVGTVISASLTATTVVTQLYQTPLSWTAGYDNRNRLTGFNRAGSASGFSYDANSNRLTAIDQTISDTNASGGFELADTALTTNQTLALQSGSNRLLGFAQTLTRVQGTRTLATTNSTINYALDANGNLTSDGLRSFEYDASNRLSKVRILKDGEAASIKYLANALGQQVFKSEPKPDQLLPDQSELGTGFIAWLKTNFGWLYAQAQTDASLGSAYMYADGQLPSWAALVKLGSIEIVKLVWSGRSIRRRLPITICNSKCGSLIA